MRQNLVWRMLEMHENRCEELDDLIQVPVSDAVLAVRLCLDRLQPVGEARRGFLKEKSWGL